MSMLKSYDLWNVTNSLDHWWYICWLQVKISYWSVSYLRSVIGAMTATRTPGPASSSCCGKQGRTSHQESQHCQTLKFYVLSSFSLVMCSFISNSCLNSFWTCEYENLIKVVRWIILLLFFHFDKCYTCGLNV